MNGNGQRKISQQVVVTQHQDFVIATGSIGARDDVVLTFEEGGVVQKVLYQAGDRVEKGAVIASLDAGTLQAELETQRSFLEKEQVRLGRYVSGPEEREQTRIEASTQVYERKLEQKSGLALVSAQRTAASIENIIRIEVDKMFTISSDDVRFIGGNISFVDRQRINKARKGIEEVLVRWRAWSNSGDINYRRVTSTLNQFGTDLRTIHDIIIDLHDILLPIRSLGNENEDMFSLLVRMRSEILDAIVETTKQESDIQVEQANYQLALAQSDEALAGGTQTDTLVQTAQVDVEQERLRRLELQIEKTRVRAPFAGVVGEVFVGIGEFVPSGTEAVRIVSQKGFELSVNITEVEIQSVSVDQEMEATIDATGEVEMVRVRTIDATEKRVNDVPVYTVVFDVINPDADLRPGMTVDVFIPSGEVVDVFAVPSGAIIKKDSESFVLVERGGTTQMVPVVVGASLEDGVVTVTGDLYAGDVVVSE